MSDPLDQLKMVTVDSEGRLKPGARLDLKLAPALRGDRCVVCRQACGELFCDSCGSLFHEECYWRAIAPASEKVVQERLWAASSDEAALYLYRCHACRS